MCTIRIQLLSGSDCAQIVQFALYTLVAHHCSPPCCDKLASASHAVYFFNGLQSWQSQISNILLISFCAQHSFSEWSAALVGVSLRLHDQSMTGLIEIFQPGPLYANISLGAAVF